MIHQTSPVAGYRAQKEQIDAAIARVLDSGQYVLGPEAERFENAFADYVGVNAGVGVASGTDAVEIALRAVGVGSGDLVFTVSHTAIGTVVGIERTGATVALVDIDSETYTMSPERLEHAIRAAESARSGRPAAVVPVHLYGQLADMPAILEIGTRHDMVVVEDSAQAHGASLDGRRAGAWGRAATFSFYATKNLAGFGDGGMVLTDDGSVADRARELREYGWRQTRFVSETTGVNSRLDELQAAVLGVRLTTLDPDNAHRRRLADIYDRGLPRAALKLPRCRPNGTHVYHQYVVASDVRALVGVTPYEGS